MRASVKFYRNPTNMKKLGLLCLVLAVLVVVFAEWTELYCNTNQECQIKFTEPHFVGPVLHVDAHNTGTTALQGGRLVMETQGYGCILFICQWADGPVLDNATCDWGWCEDDGTLLQPGQHKRFTMNFTEALIEANNTNGCCSRDREGNNLRGTSIFTNNGLETAAVFMSFYCDIRNLGPCTLETFEVQHRVPVKRGQTYWFNWFASVFGRPLH